jgi:hypothetical protein
VTKINAPPFIFPAGAVGVILLVEEYAHPATWGLSLRGFEQLLVIPLGVTLWFVAYVLLLYVAQSILGPSKTPATTDPYGDKHASRILRKK